MNKEEIKIVRVSIKWVKKAGRWCKTTFFSNGKQKQEWSKEKPTE